MKRLVWLGWTSIALTLGCGSGGDGGADAAPEPANSGFVKPTQTTKAYMEVDGSWELVGDADWSCLDTPSDDTPTTVEITLDGSVADFQTGDALANATVTAFDDTNFSGSGVGTATTDSDGAFSMALPAGGTRWAFKVEVDRALDTYTLNQYFQPDSATQKKALNSVSLLTAEALPAFINVTRTPGLGILAGAIRDCQQHEVEGAIATVSSVSGQPEHLDGAESYYFSAASTSLPVRHSLQSFTNTDGLFVVIELPPSTEAYLQVWGFTKDQDPSTDEPKLLSEIPAPILGDSVVTASLEALRSK